MPNSSFQFSSGAFNITTAKGSAISKNSIDTKIFGSKTITNAKFTMGNTEFTSSRLSSDPFFASRSSLFDDDKFFDSKFATSNLRANSRFASSSNLSTSSLFSTSTKSSSASNSSSGNIVTHTTFASTSNGGISRSVHISTNSGSSSSKSPKMGQKQTKGHKSSLPDPRSSSSGSVSSNNRLSVYPMDHQDPIFLPNLGMDFGDSASHKRMSQISAKQMAPPRPPDPSPQAPKRTDSLLRQQAHGHETSSRGLQHGNSNTSLSGHSHSNHTFPRTGSERSVSSHSSASTSSRTHGHSGHSAHDPKHQHNCTSKHVITAAYDFVAAEDRELSVEQGEILYVVDHSGGNWWQVESKRTGRKGFVPISYLKEPELMEPWFAGKITRIESEQRILANEMKPGAFLVRQKDTGEYVLAVHDTEDTAHHYMINKSDKGFLISGYQHYFPSLLDLIEHFQSKDSSGLCCRLTTAAPLIVNKQDMYYDKFAKWEVNRKEITLEIKVGAGNFGDVFYGKWNQMEVAVKTLKPGTMEPKGFIKEAMLLTKLDHPNLVKLYAVCTKEEPFFIITEYLDHGSLLELLRLGPKENKLTAREVVNMATQIASGMSYLENRKLVHRDLAARNVLVGEVTNNGPTVKVADFGLARQIKEDDQVYEMSQDTKIPIRWTAPESIRDQIFSSKSDVWSYGILLYEMATEGKTPYGNMTNSEVIAKISRGYRLPRPAICPEYIYDETFLKCLAERPEDRPTFRQLFTFFDELHVFSKVHRISASSPKPPASPTLQVH